MILKYIKKEKNKTIQAMLILIRMRNLSQQHENYFSHW